MAQVVRRMKEDCIFAQTFYGLRHGKGVGNGRVLSAFCARHVVYTLALSLLINFRTDGSVTSAFSLKPAELAMLVSETRQAWLAHGRVSYGPQSKSEAASVQFRRSLYFVCDLAAGDTIDATAVRAIRPGHGLPPGEIDRLIGRRVSQAVVRGTPVSWELVR